MASRADSAELFSMIEKLSGRYRTYTYGRWRGCLKPARIATIRQAKEIAKTATFQTSIGAKGETNFLSLPGELRNELYRLALIQPKTIRLRVCRRSREHPFLRWAEVEDARPWIEPALLRVNRNIHLEASSVYSGLNGFSVCVNPEDLEEVASWLRSVISRCGNDPFHAFHFSVIRTRFKWLDLYKLEPLFFVFAELGLKL